MGRPSQLSFDKQTSGRRAQVAQQIPCVSLAIADSLDELPLPGRASLFENNKDAIAFRVLLRCQ